MKTAEATVQSNVPDTVNLKEKRFDWPVCHEAEGLVEGHIADFLARNSFANDLARRMRDETGTLILDWTDHLVLPAAHANALRAAGFVEDPSGESPDKLTTLHHPEAMLPRVLLAPKESSVPSILALRVEQVEDFLAAHGLRHEIVGQPLSRFRRAVVAEENGTRVAVVERRGYRGFIPADA